ncbi:MAG: hypothetical protein C5B49_09080 [Bdellovibrio sp.]|nr:MAG: hypothetical protein C5B49_09080 [Bdellovibrio sp.]
MTDIWNFEMNQTVQSDIFIDFGSTSRFHFSLLGRAFFALLLYSLPAPATQDTTSFCSDVFGRNYGALIAEKPIDAMGRDFQEIFGGFIRTREATSENLEDLALDLFNARLALSRKYNTAFAQMMEPSGEAGWQKRWKGEGISQAWSFGIHGHLREGSVWRQLMERLPVEESHLEMIDSSIFAVHQSLEPSRTGIARVWHFPYEVGGQDVSFYIYQVNKNTFYIGHAKDKQVPLLRQRLRDLWQRAMFLELAGIERTTALFEFEWVWFWTNPFGRAGASLGDALSLLVQKQMERQGLPIRIRSDFENLDLVALSMHLEDYVQWRQNSGHFH